MPPVCFSCHEDCGLCILNACVFSCRKTFSIYFSESRLRTILHCKPKNICKYTPKCQKTPYRMLFSHDMSNQFYDRQIKMKYSDELKKIIAEQYETGTSIPKLCSEYHISRSCAYNWIGLLKKHKRYSCKEISAREINLMENELDRLRKENEIFRRCNLTAALSLQDKLKQIEQLKDEFGVRPLCRVLEVRRSTFYHYLYRSPEKTQIELGDDVLRPKVREHFENSKERFGARKIRAKLIEEGLVVSQRRVLRLMDEMKLVCKQVRLRYWSTTSRKYKYYRNKLKKEFKQTAPNLVWVSDITYIRVKDDFYHVCVVIDLFSRKVLAYKISKNIDTALVMSTFDTAFEIRKCPANLTFHSDQGEQYTSYKFRSHLRELQVMQSFSSPGSPLDNAVAESFFACMKREELSHNLYDAVERLEKDVAEFADYYNRLRPHQKLGFRTPEQIERDYYSALKN